MFKKRGKIRALILLALGVFIAVVFIILIFNVANKSFEEKYTLSDDEKMELGKIMQKIRIDNSPLCKAFLERDINYCEKTHEDKEDCFYYLVFLKAITEKNSSYCGFLQPEDKRYCISLINGTLRCDSIEGDNKYYCLAFTKMDEKNCESIESEKIREDCKSDLRFFIATTQENIDKCNGLNNEWDRIYCSVWVEKSAAKCPDEQVSIDEVSVLRQFAIENKNEKMCSLINRTKDKDICILGVAVNKDTSLCQKIKTLDIKNACESVIKKDKSMCNNVNDADAKILCNANIIV